ncbi:MAG: DUF3458 domain-containing protein, partial [Desulfopila sp.]|nr:DUF3458 domain-containing protein [Desulfopila sp.]
PPSPKQQKKSPFHIPIEIGLLEFSKDAIEGTVTLEKTTRKLLELKKSKERFSFKNLKNKPLLSFLRNFSAPVKVRKFQPKSELFLLMAHDDDLFNRWNYAHQLTVEVIKNVTLSLKFGKKPIVDKDYLEALSVCIQKQEDMALCAKILTFPSEPYLAQQMKVVEPELLHRSVTIVKKTVAIFLWNWLEDTYRQCYEADSHSVSAAAMAQRSLKNCCLAYLSLPGIEDSAAQQLCLKHLRMSRNMTDVFAALSALSHFDSENTKIAFREFYQQWQRDSLVVDKWLTLQATSTLPSTLETVKLLMSHEAFSLLNPNKVRALIGSFCSLNHYRFHDESGAGYRFLVQQVLKIDSINSQIAARLLTPLTSYLNYSQKLKVMMEEQLRFIADQKDLSADVYEIIARTLDSRS